MDLPTKISIIALIVSILTGIFGALGGIPGIRDVFFSKPKMIIDAFMPAIVYDAGNSRDTIYPKFALKGVLKLSNPNKFDINIAEMKLYGRTQYEYKGKPIFYDLDVAGLGEQGGGTIKAYSSAVLKFGFAHFKNDSEPGVMLPPMKGGYSKELGGLLFNIYVPSLNQLFTFNKNRVPGQLVPESQDGRLSFAVSFNNQLIKINPKLITQLVSFSKEEWEDSNKVDSLFFATANLVK